MAVALGVLLDTIVVRAVLVTALNLDVGPRMWWPSRLAGTDGPETGVPPEPEAPDAQESSGERAGV
jgi:RND superfamily putative drug exporter